MSTVSQTGGHSVPPDLTTGSVVLDIGGETGALVIHTDAQRLGEEIEVTCVDNGGWRTHVAVLKRRIPRGTAYAAVFSALREGDYRILGAAAPPAACARVIGGGVVEVDWRR
jgi:hypothetical protein